MLNKDSSTFYNYSRICLNLLERSNSRSDITCHYRLEMHHKKNSNLFSNITRWHTSRDPSAKCSVKHGRISIIEKVEIH